MTRKFCVLVTGGGTNLQAILDAIEKNEICAEISKVISSKHGAYALQRAEKYKIATDVISKADFCEKEDYENALLASIQESEAEFVVLAGYLPILGKKVVKMYPNKIINVHPALIPSFCGKGFYGLKVHEAALEYGVKVTGATVHIVDEGTDTGPIIFQKAVDVLPDDDAKSLQQRVMQEAEHILLPKAIALMAADKIIVKNRKVTIL